MSSCTRIKVISLVPQFGLPHLDVSLKFDKLLEAFDFSGIGVVVSFCLHYLYQLGELLQFGWVLQFESP